MIKTILISLIIMFINNLYYTEQYYDSYNSLSNRYSILSQNEFNTFESNLYNYNELIYDLKGIQIYDYSATMPVISNDLLLIQNGGKHMDSFKLLFYNNFENIDDFIAENRILYIGDFPVKPNECIISSKLMEKNNLKLFDTITVMNPMDWEMEFTFKIVGVYNDFTKYLDPNRNYTSRRNEIITNISTIYQTEQKDKLCNSRHIAFTFLTESNHKLNCVDSTKFYAYQNNYIKKYRQISLIVLSILLLMYIIYHNVEKIVVNKIVNNRNIISKYLKISPSKKGIYISLLLSILVFSTSIAIIYRPLNKWIIHYVLNSERSLTINTHGFPMFETFFEFYVGKNEKSVFYPWMILIFFSWFLIRYVKYLKIFNRIKQPKQIEMVESMILYFNNKEKLDYFLENNNYLTITRNKIILKKLYLSGSVSNDVLIERYIEFANKHKFKIIVICIDDIDCSNLEIINIKKDIHFILCTIKIHPKIGYKVYGYINNDRFISIE